jgi:hypothetical protein
MYVSFLKSIVAYWCKFPDIGSLLCPWYVLAERKVSLFPEFSLLADGQYHFVSSFADTYVNMEWACGRLGATIATWYPRWRMPVLLDAMRAKLTGMTTAYLVQGVGRGTANAQLQLHSREHAILQLVMNLFANQPLSVSYTTFSKAF